MQADHFSYAELGALLIAIGTEMIQSDVPASLARENPGGRVFKSLAMHGISPDTARQLTMIRLSDVTHVTKVVRRKFSNRLARLHAIPN